MSSLSSLSVVSSSMPVPRLELEDGGGGGELSGGGGVVVVGVSWGGSADMAVGMER